MPGENNDQPQPIQEFQFDPSTTPAQTNGAEFNF